MRSPVRTTLLLISLAIVFAADATEIPVNDPPIVNAATNTLSRNTPVVVAGDGFLVAWPQFYAANPNGSYVRVYDAAGTPRTATQIATTSGGSPQGVWTGRDWILFSGLGSLKFGYTLPVDAIYAQRVYPDGTVDPTRKTLALASRLGYVLSVARVGNRIGVLVITDLDERLIIIDEQLNVVSNTVVGSASNIPYRAVVAKGADGLMLIPSGYGNAVAEHDGTYATVGGTYQITAKLLDANGEVTSEIALGEGNNARSIAWDRNAWLTTFESTSARLCTARFTNASDVSVSCGDETARAPFVAVGAQRTFTAWVDDDIQIATDSGIASLTPASQGPPVLALDAFGRAVAWFENNHIHLGGFLHDGSRRREAIIDSGAYPIGMQLVASRTQSLLAWEEQNRVYLQRVDVDGPIGARIDLGKGFGVRVASRGDGWIVVWCNGSNMYDNDASIVSTRVDLTGATTNVQSFAAPKTRQYTPAIAATRDGYVVIWYEYETPNDGPIRIRLVAEPLDMNGIRYKGGTRLLDTATRQPMQPAIGCNDESCYVTWWEETAHYGMLIAHDGTARTDPRFLFERALGESFVRVLRDQSYRVFSYTMSFDVTRDGVPTTARPWTPQPVVPGGFEVEEDGTIVAAYMRAERAWLRELTPRRRAMR